MTGKSSGKPIAKIAIITISIFVIIAAVSFWVLSSQNSPFTANRAEEIIKPVERSLVEAGAVKVCSLGGTGKEASNNIPWYNASYQLNVGKDQAIEIIKKVAADNGVSLVQEEPGYYKTILSFGSSKPSAYSDLIDGSVGLGMSLYTNTNESELGCWENGKTYNLIGDTTHTALDFGVSLPRYKDR